MAFCGCVNPYCTEQSVTARASPCGVVIVLTPVCWWFMQGFIILLWMVSVPLPVVWRASPNFLPPPPPRLRVGEKVGSSGKCKCHTSPISALSKWFCSGSARLEVVWRWFQQKHLAICASRDLSSARISYMWI